MELKKLPADPLKTLTGNIEFDFGKNKKLVLNSLIVSVQVATTRQQKLSAQRQRSLPKYIILHFVLFHRIFVA